MKQRSRFALIAGLPPISFAFITRFMFRGILPTTLLVFWLAAATVAQTKEPRAYRYIEFEGIQKESLRLIIDGFWAVLKNTDSQGYIVNYGSEIGIKNRKKLLLNSDLSCREYDCPRITLVDGPLRSRTKTILWIVPKDAQNPKIDP